MAGELCPSPRLTKGEEASDDELLLHSLEKVHVLGACVRSPYKELSTDARHRELGLGSRLVQDVPQQGSFPFVVPGVFRVVHKPVAGVDMAWNVMDLGVRGNVPLGLIEHQMLKTRLDLHG